MDHVVVAVLIAVATTNLKLDVGHSWATPVGPSLAVVNLHCSLHVMSLHGSATADASVMAPSPFAVKKSVGVVGELEEVEGGGALSQEVVLLVVVLSPASPSPGVGAVGGGAAACSPTVSKEEEEVVWAGRGACPHASHALARGAVPATASGPFAHLTRAHKTFGSLRPCRGAWRCSSRMTP